MANLTSKLVVGGSVVLVLLMLFSAIPVAAENTNNDSDYVVIDVDSYDGPITKDEWEWDGTNVFTFKKDIAVNKICIYNNCVR